MLSTSLSVISIAPAHKLLNSSSAKPISSLSLSSTLNSKFLESPFFERLDDPVITEPLYSMVSSCLIISSSRSMYILEWIFLSGEMRISIFFLLTFEQTKQHSRPLLANKTLY